MTSLHDVLEAHVSNGSVPGAVALVARGDQVEVEAAGSARRRRHGSDGQGLDLPHRLDHQAHHRRGGHDAGRGRPDRARRPGRASGCRSWRHRRSSARRPARSTTWSRPPGRSPWPTCSPSAPGTASRPTSRCPAVGLLFSELRAGAAAAAARRGAGRVDGGAVPHPAAAPAGRGLAVQHLLRHPGRADRPGLGPPAARVPGRAAVRAARHGRHRVRGTGRQAGPVHQLLPGRCRRAASSWSTPRTGSGAARRRSRPAPAGWSRPSTTGSPSPGCCSPAGPPAAAACCRPTSVRQMTTDHLTQAQREAGGCSWRARAGASAARSTSRPIDPWNVPGRYGWVGGTGTAAHITPSTGAVTILLTQLEMAGPTPPAADAGLLAVRGRAA